MSVHEYLARGQAPVPVLPAGKRRAAVVSVQSVERRAERARALVAARACQCAAGPQPGSWAAECELRAERAAELRAERELRRFEQQLDREDDMRVAGIIRAFEYKLDKKHERELAKRKRKERKERAKKHREYLARCARRAAERRRRYSLVWSGRAVRTDSGAPATQPSRLGQEEYYQLQAELQRVRDEQLSRLIGKPVRSSRINEATLTQNLGDKLVAALAKQSDRLTQNPGRLEQPGGPGRFRSEDYTQPSRPWGGSAKEAHKMEHEDLLDYDEDQRHEIAGVEFGSSLPMQPTHAVLVACAMCACGAECERTDWAKTQLAADVGIRDGAEPGSLSPGKVESMLRSDQPVPSFTPERRF